MNFALVIPEFSLGSGPYRSLSIYSLRTASALGQLGHTAVIFAGGSHNENLNVNNVEVRRIKIHKRDERWYSNKFLHKPYTTLRKAFYEKTAWHKWNDHLERKYYCNTLSEQLNAALLAAHKEKAFNLVHYAQECAVGFHRPSSIPSVVRVSIPHKTHMGLEGFIADKYIRSRARYEAQAIKKADALLGSGQEIINAQQATFGLPVSTITPVYTAVATPDASLYERDLAGKKYIVFYGSLNLVNGADTVADMLPDLFRKFADHYFVFAGTPSASPYRKMNMLQYAEKKSTEHRNRLIIFDTLSQAQLSPIIQNSVAVVLPSRYDSFSNAKIEALAHGKAIVCTKDSGVSNLVEHGKNGFLINKEAHKELFHALSHIIEMPADAKQNMEGEARKMSQRFSAAVAGKELVEFYTQVIGRKKG